MKGTKNSKMKTYRRKLNVRVEKKEKIWIYWNDGLKERKSYKRIWKDEIGFFYRDSANQRIYIEDELKTYKTNMGEEFNVNDWKECEHQPELTSA